jgi:EAL and modified HD-GYP domain-containing signal transduction protein
MGQLSPLFARQPIFNCELEVIAYELLFRSHESVDSDSFDGDHASSHVIYYAYGDQTIREVMGDCKAFVNFTRKMLIAPPPLPPDQLIVEVLENVEPDDDVVRGLRRLKNAGYQIALDDFFLTRENEILLEFADIVKIDVLALSEDEVNTHVSFLKDREIELLAEKVETYEMLDRCKQQGFDYFQGYFLSRPQVIEGVKINDDKRFILEMISKLTDPMAAFDDVVQTISADPRLSAKVLQLINMTSVGLRREIASLSQAVAMVGLTQVRNWAIFLELTGNANKPRELCSLSLTRARFCELLGTRIYGRALGETAFTTGLLSSLDAFLDLPMDQLVNKLSFADQVESALLRHDGKIGRILQLAVLHEQGNWDAMDWNFLREQGLAEDELNSIYTSSVAWTKPILATKDLCC